MKMSNEIYFNRSSYISLSNETIKEYLISNNSNYSFSTGQSDQTTEYEYTIWQKSIFLVFIIPIIFFAISGNILVIIAISKYQNLKITNNIFLCSLAVADCAVATLAMTLNALQLISGHWYLKAFMCRMWLSCDVLFSTASILHLFCVSLDRYLSISDKYAYSYIREHPTKSLRVRVMIATCWITSALLSFVPIFTNLFTTEEYAETLDNLDYENGLCQMKVNVQYRFISSIVSFWLPGFGMILFYTLVMRKAQRMQYCNDKIYENMRRNRKGTESSIGHSHSVSITQSQMLKLHRNSSTVTKISKLKTEYKVYYKICSF